MEHEAEKRLKKKKKGEKISCKDGGFPKGMIEREGRGRERGERHHLILLLIGRWWA